MTRLDPLGKYEFDQDLFFFLKSQKQARHHHPKQIVHQFEAEKQIVQSKGDLQINSPYLIKKNRETFEPFIEDDVPFDEYSIPIIIKADADISASSNQAKAAVSKPKGAAGKDSINTGSIKLVMAGSGCESAEKVEQICVGKHQFLVL
ncbi:hypothetical protein V6N12_024404 [Hibiscus sabdariffa]|uniref:Uncharacterized protein n=1 Tax=Hibiscus sabdariffa TaxID=183260 RepID=A0ABR2G0Z0_9ROSI